MTQKIVLHKFKNGLCIDHVEDESFCVESLLSELEKESGIKVLSKENVHSSFGPLGYIDNYKTSSGILRVEVQLEEIQYCVQLDTESSKLLNCLAHSIENSKLYKVCSSYGELNGSV
jgi:hypothetical protein